MSEAPIHVAADGSESPFTAEMLAQREEDAAAAAAAPPAPVVTAKADMWRRCTDDEASKLYDAMQQAPLRARMVFDAALNVSTADELYPTLRQIIVSVVGEDRAAEILAAS